MTNSSFKLKWGKYQEVDSKDNPLQPLIGAFYQSDSSGADNWYIEVGSGEECVDRKLSEEVGKAALISVTGQCTEAATTLHWGDDFLSKNSRNATLKLNNASSNQTVMSKQRHIFRSDIQRVNSWRSFSSSEDFLCHEHKNITKQGSLNPKLRFNFCIPLRKVTSSNSSTATEPLTPTISSDEDDILGAKPINSPQSKIVNVRYSARSEIGDGSEKQEPSKSKMKMRLLQPNGCHVKTSYWAEKNARTYMEDRIVIDGMGTTCFPNETNSCRYNTEQISSSQVLVSQKRCKVNNKVLSCQSVLAEVDNNSQLPLSLFGIFDGHGGSRASTFCCDWVSSCLKHQPSFPCNLEDALKSSFVALDEDYSSLGHADGTTACVCVIVGRERVICANAGDSRAVLVKVNGTVIKLSHDHKPSVPEETKRITEMGGKIIFSGHWRVEGKLSVSRGIGDPDLKPYISPEPDLCQHDLKPEDRFVVLASDGIWDVFSNEEIAEAILSKSKLPNDINSSTSDENLKGMARWLCERARDLGSKDNLSAIIVDLQAYDGERVERFEL